MNIYSAYISKHNSNYERPIILLMIQNGKGDLDSWFKQILILWLKKIDWCNSENLSTTKLGNHITCITLCLHYGLLVV